jgi:hypothetical protein
LSDDATSSERNRSVILPHAVCRILSIEIAYPPSTRSFLMKRPSAGLAVRVAASAWAWAFERITTTPYRRGVATRSQDLETTRYAELDSENVMKGEAPATDKVENAASDTRRAGDSISEIISSGMSILAGMIGEEGGIRTA